MRRIGAIIVGLACLSAAVHATAPAYSDFSDDSFKGVKTGMKEMKDGERPRVDYNPAKDPNAGKPSQALEWVSIPGGEFTLGSFHFSNAKPIEGKTYAIKTFDVSKTLVTVEQYAECVVKGGCTKPEDTGKYCNSDKPGRKLHPVNCVDWDQANQYAKFKDARLLTESEYEYAARSGGKNQKYPWGNDAPTCVDKDGKNGNVVMYGNGGYGCGNDGTMPVCSKDAGNTKIEGLPAEKQLCDMVGNVWQWVQDKYQSSYANTPLNGSASEGSGSGRVMRGGSFGSRDAGALRADYRYVDDPAYRSIYFGFRLARSSR